ncbi:MAG: hypothetical protein QOC75_4777, partial [Pseudonocardiales bacterium]|nr:hypothetical protein [Pseudonocardiales bacterium]
TRLRTSKFRIRNGDINVGNTG